MSDNRISSEHQLDEASGAGEFNGPAGEKSLKVRSTVRGHCARVKRDGSACRAWALAGSSLCRFHDPASKKPRIEASRRGGKKKRAAVLAPDTPDFPLNNAADASALLARSINQVLRGELDPKHANSIGYLINIKIRAMDQGKLEERLAVLERALKDKAPVSTLFDRDEELEGVL